MAELYKTVKDWANDIWNPILSGGAVDAVNSTVRGVRNKDLIKKIINYKGSSTVTGETATTATISAARNDVIGLPLRYNDLADPGKRVYSNSILRDLPLISIIPGSPKFIAIANDPNLSSEAGVIRSLVKGKIDTDGSGVNNESISRWLAKSKASDDTTNVRYYNFASDYQSYFKYVQVMLNTLYIKMDLGKFFDFGEAFPMDFSKRSSLAFFYDVNATSISESTDNDFGTSQLDGLAKSAGQISREIRFILGKNVTPDMMSRVGNADDPNNKNSEVDAKKREIGNLESVFNNLKQQGRDVGSVLYNGANVMYPEVWQDSRFTRSYSLGFKFSSPYGDPLSIFQFVYVPFVCLLTLCMPRQDSIAGYGPPFIIKADVPGNFSIDMGVVTSMTYKKADDNAWSKDGYPLEMSVTLQCKDLYPAMMMSNSFQALIANIGLLTYLENMAGLTITESKTVSDITAFISDKVGNILNIPDMVQAGLGDAWTDFTSNRDFAQGLINKLSGR